MGVVQFPAYRWTQCTPKPVFIHKSALISLSSAIGADIFFTGKPRTIFDFLGNWVEMLSKFSGIKNSEHMSAKSLGQIAHYKYHISRIFSDTESEGDECGSRDSRPGLLVTYPAVVLRVLPAAFESGP